MQRNNKERLIECFLKEYLYLNDYQRLSPEEMKEVYIELVTKDYKDVVKTFKIEKANELLMLFVPLVVLVVTICVIIDSIVPYILFVVASGTGFVSYMESMDNKIDELVNRISNDYKFMSPDELRRIFELNVEKVKTKEIEYLKDILMDEEKSYSNNTNNIIELKGLLVDKYNNKEVNNTIVNEIVEKEESITKDNIKRRVLKKGE